MMSPFYFIRDDDISSTISVEEDREMSNQCGERWFYTWIATEKAPGKVSPNKRLTCTTAGREIRPDGMTVERFNYRGTLTSWQEEGW